MSIHINSRRGFIRGLGAAVALPALEAFHSPLRAAGAGSRALATTASGAPLRMAYLYVPNGVNLEHWRPNGWGESYTMGRSFKALEKHKEDFQIFTGFEQANAKHPVLNGVKQIFGDTDVYEAAPPADATILVRGQVLKTMEADSGPADYKKTNRATKMEQGINDPMMPVIWTRELDKQRIVTCTMGAATDLQSEDLRRAVVNGVFWGLGLDVPAKANVDVVGEFKNIMYGFGTYRKNVRPSDHAMK